MANGHFQLGISPNADGSWAINYYNSLSGDDTYLVLLPDGALVRREMPQAIADQIDAGDDVPYKSWDWEQSPTTLPEELTRIWRKIQDDMEAFRRGK